jgi:hypothetical protein
MPFVWAYRILRKLTGACEREHVLSLFPSARGPLPSPPAGEGDGDAGWVCTRQG